MLARVHHDIPIALLLMAFSAGAYGATARFESIAFYPRALILVLSTFAAVVLVDGIRKSVRLSQDRPVTTAPDETGYTLVAMARPLVVLAATALYVWALPFAGFWLSTSVFVAIVAKLIGLAGVIRPLAVSLGFTVFAYLLFAWQLGVPLPRGLVF